jgi:hypothetical protein
MDLAFQTEKWDTLRRSLQEKIGALDAYWQVFDSTRKYSRYFQFSRLGSIKAVADPRANFGKISIV